MSPKAGTLYTILSGVLNIPVNKIGEDSSPDTVATWDSMSHVNLILALESQYGIQLDPAEAMDIQSVRLIRLTLAEHGIDEKDL